MQCSVTRNEEILRMANIRKLLNQWLESWWEVIIREGIQVQYENVLNFFLLPNILKMSIMRWAGSLVIWRVIRTSLKQFLSPDLKGRNNFEHIRFFLLFIMAIISGPCGQISSQFYYIIIRRWFRFWYRSRLIRMTIFCEANIFLSRISEYLKPHQTYLPIFQRAEFPSHMHWLLCSCMAFILQ